MTIAAVILFLLIYFGMIIGCWPGLAIDRTGIALLGAIAFMGIQGISVQEAFGYIDVSAIAILFSFMIISAQFYFAGFYTHLIEKLEKTLLSPKHLLLLVIFTTGILSALLINDIVCLALTPLMIRVCFKKNLNPVPYLLGLACASNVGSALTLVGNPQNLLIGQVLRIPFAEYLKYSFVPTILGLFATWGIIVLMTKEKWTQPHEDIHPKMIPYNNQQSRKGVAVLAILMGFFLFTVLPRDQLSLIAAGTLLMSRKMASETMLSFIDWQLLVLFSGLFIINQSLLQMTPLNSLPELLSPYGIDLNSPLWIAGLSFVLSNIVSNVPAVMLLLPFTTTAFQGSILAISSTLAGNLFLISSIANLIVVSQAKKFGIDLDWKQHAKIGLPVTVVTCLIAIGWVYLI